MDYSHYVDFSIFDVFSRAVFRPRISSGGFRAARISSGGFSGRARLDGCTVIGFLRAVFGPRDFRSKLGSFLGQKVRFCRFPARPKVPKLTKNRPFFSTPPAWPICRPVWSQKHDFFTFEKNLQNSAKFTLAKPILSHSSLDLKTSILRHLLKYPSNPSDDFDFQGPPDQVSLSRPSKRPKMMNFPDFDLRPLPTLKTLQNPSTSQTG